MPLQRNTLPFQRRVRGFVHWNFFFPLCPAMDDCGLNKALRVFPGLPAPKAAGEGGNAEGKRRGPRTRPPGAPESGQIHRPCPAPQGLVSSRRSQHGRYFPNFCWDGFSEMHKKKKKEDEPRNPKRNETKRNKPLRLIMQHEK